MGDVVTGDGAGIDRDPQANPRARDSLLTAVIDNAPFGAHMYRLDDDDRLVFIGFNHKAEEMLGIEHHALIGLTLEDAFPGNVDTDTPEAYKRVAREGGVWDLDQYAYDSSGVAGVFEVHAFWFGPRRVCVFFRDVTEKRKSELELRDANEMLAVAQRAAGTGFWSWDVPTGQLTWTPEFLDLFGLPADTKASFETWRATLHPDDLEAAEALIMRAINEHAPLENEYRIVLPNGTVRWIGAVGTATYGEDGSPLRMAGICMDIDDRKRREEEIRALNADLERRVEERTRELSLTNRELQDFVYSASHDLRAPLRALDGFSEVLLEDCGGTLDEEHVGYLRRIRAASQHMAGLIDALLALSRVGRREVDLRVVDLSAAALAIVEELREAEPDRKVSVSVEPELQARTDEALADIVLRNIIGNAWKFTSQRESASIEVGSVRRNRLMYFVRDDGAGFDLSTPPRCSARSTGSTARTSSPARGSASRLSGALDKLDGGCWAEGAPGRGATFFYPRLTPRNTTILRRLRQFLYEDVRTPHAEGVIVMFERILLAVDDSEESKKAIKTAVSLARATQGEILVVHVHAKDMGFQVKDDVETRLEAEMLIEAAVDVVKKAGVPVVGDLRAARIDRVAKEILDAAESYRADCIVVGSRGSGPFTQMLLGSVANQVVHLAHCPVVVARDQVPVAA